MTNGCGFTTGTPRRRLRCAPGARGRRRPLIEWCAAPRSSSMRAARPSDASAGTTASRRCRSQIACHTAHRNSRAREQHPPRDRWTAANTGRRVGRRRRSERKHVFALNGVLVPTNLGEPSRTTIHYGITFARQFGAKLYFSTYSMPRGSMPCSDGASARSPTTGGERARQPNQAPSRSRATPHAKT